MEDFIFDDDADEVGAEVEAHCPKCKADTQHVVVSKYEDEIRRVQCNPCGDVHPYRKPRGEEGEEEPAPVKKKPAKAKPTYDQIMAKHGKKPPKVYQLGEYFKELEVLSHPKFGVGYVTENIGDDKIEVTFKEDKRVLVHNRKGLALPFMRPTAPAASADKAGGGKAAKGDKAKAAAAQTAQAGKNGAPAAAPALAASANGAPAKGKAAAIAAPAAAKGDKGKAAKAAPAPAPVAAAKGDKGKAAAKAAPAPAAAKAAAKPAKAAPVAKAPVKAAPVAKGKPVAAKPVAAKKPPAKAAARTATKKPTAKAPAKKVKKGR